MKSVIFWAYAGGDGHVAYRFFFDTHYVTWAPDTGLTSTIPLLYPEDRERLISLFREDNEVWHEIE